MMKRTAWRRLRGVDVNPMTITRLTGVSPTALVIALSISVSFFFSGAIASMAGGASANDVGENTFKTTCATCHGDDGSGNTPVGTSLKIPDLHSTEVQNNSDEQLSQIITNGKNAMPPFKSTLTDDQIHALVSYIRQLKPKK